jgi:GAF domain-containing protein
VQPLNLLLQSIAEAALEATGARQSFLFTVDGAQLCVVASAGGPGGSLLGQRVPVQDGPAGYVLASGQPLILTPTDDAGGAAAGSGGPTWALGRQGSSVLCVPCAFDDRVVGVLQLVDKTDGSTFSFDDLQLVTVLSPIAGTALHEGGGLGMLPPAPQDVARELGELAAVDPVRYAAVAAMIRAVIGPRA